MGYNHSILSKKSGFTILFLSFSLFLSLFCFTPSMAQHNKDKKGGDFLNIKGKKVVIVGNQNHSAKVLNYNVSYHFPDSIRKKDSILQIRHQNALLSLRFKTLEINLPSSPEEDSLYVANLEENEYEEDADLEEESEDEAGSVNIHIPKNIVREDTTNYDDISYQGMVIISEELAIDSVWVTLTEYYAVWDSETVNPYKIDASKYKEERLITLYDTTKNLYWSAPLDTGIVTSNFGFRRHRWHHGIDLDLDTGDPVYATFDGIVRIARSVRGGYGKHVVLRHYNGLETLYGHLSRLDVEVGFYVKAGQMIGKGGSTGRSSGPHLHFEMRYQGNSIDPAEFFDFPTNQIKYKDFVLSPKHFKHFKAVAVRQVTYHRVGSGDSLWKISKRYRTSISALCKLNRISPKTRLRIGQRIRIR